MEGSIMDEKLIEALRKVVKSDLAVEILHDTLLQVSRAGKSLSTDEMAHLLETNFNDWDK